MSSLHNVQENTTHKTTHDRYNPEKITRPLNSFMLYKRDCKYKYLDENPSMNSRDISRVVAEKWKYEAESVKNAYRDQAATAMREHKIKYPNYRYSNTCSKKPCQKAKSRNKKPRQKAKSIMDVVPPTVAGNLFLDTPEDQTSLLSDVIHEWDFSQFHFCT